ncbi:L-rhamnose mutarotase [Methylobacterium phyllostachyos]|uniref:L-rhamnose mutarotase n=1 Tax=Methylobacterium phyllostachyos TaxID=582672 RepID=A0A1G9XBT7_9HYPH|nr:L-rhamnose mutarotase [Methylobacterium phyllostachyos]SDM93906.1 L-rhamnose mutarotase [Methylobacterium phyllostachyos]
MIGPFDPAIYEKHAFAMRLRPGCADAYRERHDALWPELADLLRQAGVADYSIHLEPGTNLLFAVLWRRRDHGMAALPEHPVMRRWWAHMADLMETEPSNAPVVLPLQTLFHLP